MRKQAVLEKPQLHENRDCAMLSAPGAGLRQVVGTAGKRWVGWRLQLLWWQLGGILLRLLPWQPEVLSDAGRTLISLVTSDGECEQPANLRLLPPARLQVLRCASLCAR